VHVVDTAGHLLWKWNFREATHLNRLGSLAVSPACDAVVVGGDVDHKFVWIARHRRGHTSFRTRGTPRAVKFSLRGDLVAVATGASLGYLLSDKGEVRWSGKLDDLPITWAHEARTPSTTSRTEFAKDDVEAIRLALNWWPAAYDVRRSDDGSWRIERETPFRGSGTEIIQLWGPGDKAPRWRKAIGCADILISGDGEFVMTSGDVEHSEYGAGGNPPCDRVAVHVFDHDGRDVRSWPLTQLGSFIGLTPDGRGFLYAVGDSIERRDLTGEISWTIFSYGGSLSPDRRLLLELAPIERPANDPRPTIRMFQLPDR